MKISLIHPSRGRALKSYQTCIRWLYRSGLPAEEIELIRGLDEDDNSNYSFYNPDLFFNGLYHVDAIGNHKSVVEATNHACKKATGGILIYLSDDFDCPDNWGPLVLKEFADATGPRLIKVDDMLQPFHVPVLTIPIMNRALYERLGYFFHPGYKSMFCDEHLFHVANKLRALKFCPHLKFEHKHVSVGKADDDETYRRSSANWKQGQDLFETHKRQGFPV